MKPLRTILFFCLLITGQKSIAQAIGNGPIKGVGVVVNYSENLSLTKTVISNDSGEIRLNFLRPQKNITLKIGSKKAQNKNIKIGICQTKNGYIKEWYSLSEKGQVTLKSIKAGDFYIKIINLANQVCPNGYKLKDGLCVPDIQIDNGRYVWIHCEGGRMEYMEVRAQGASDGDWGGSVVKGPQTGWPCTGNWFHMTCIDRIVATDIDDETTTNNQETETSSTNIKGRKGGTTKGNNGINIELGAGMQTPSNENTPNCCDGMQLSIGAGINKPSSATKAKSNGLGDIQFLAELYVPVVPLDTMIDFGISTNLQYTMGTGNLSLDDYKVYNIQGQTTAPTKRINGISTGQSGFRATVSPNLSFKAKKIIIRAGLGLGYMTQTQKELSVIQTSQNGPMTNEYNLLKQSVTKTNGFLLLPNLRMSYCLGKMAIWAEGQYLMGPKIENTATRFVPQGLANTNGNYTLTQMELGTIVPYVRESESYKSLGVNVGVSLSLSKPKPNRGRHTCLICGRKHRGICRFGVTESLELKQLIDVIESNCKGLYDGSADNCDAKKGVCCTDDVAVNANYDLNKLYSIVESQDIDKIKEFVVESNLESALGKQGESQLWQAILKGVKNGVITLELAKSSKKSLLLKTLHSKQKPGTTQSSKNEYIGHVTLLR